MINLNEVKLIGRIGNIPEINRTKDNKPIAKFSIATSESWIDKSINERKERTEWHNIVIYNTKLAEIIENKKDDLKGSLIYVAGKIRYEKWVDSTGKDQKSTQVVLDATGQCIIFPKNNNSSIESDHSIEKTEDEDDLPF